VRIPEEWIDAEARKVDSAIERTCLEGESVMSVTNEGAIAEGMRSLGGCILLGLMFVATAVADGFVQYTIGGLALLVFVAGVSDDLKRKESAAKSRDAKLSPE
jgi:hypothetical protein